MTKEEMLEAWAKTVLKIWTEQIHELNIKSTMELLQSFTVHVFTHANGDAARIEFAYNYYGKFVDMGVGHGVTLAEVDMPGHNRRPKPWYSKTFLREVKKLASIMAQKYALQGALAIVDNIRDGGKISTRYLN